ncbi:MAG: hypothetical protein PHG69_06485, partial [Candidatus Omnitrophica bacterium]|nr:hypothetical protein [Candidatus Omnitrophota bacterium]
RSSEFIGTTNPAEKLNVGGNIAATGNIDADGSIFAQTVFETPTNIVADGNAQIGGKAGVGTYFPTPQFHVDAASTAWDSSTGLAWFQDSGDRVIAIGGLGMFRRDGNDDNAELRFNYLGYLGSNTRYRDFNVYDGKGALILQIDGSEKEVSVAANANFAKNGNPIMQCSWEGRMCYADDGSGNDFAVVCRNSVIERWCHMGGGCPRGLASGAYTCN